MEAFEIFNGNTTKLLGTLVVLLVLYFIRTIIVKIINKKVENLRRRYIWRQTVSYLFFVIAIILIIVIFSQVFGKIIHSLLTVISLVAAALTIVSKELLLNLVAHSVIMWRGLFNIGDRIQIGTNMGDVMEIGPVYITLAEIGGWVEGDEPTGRILKIPNSAVLTQSVANYSRGLSLIWHELSVPLSLDSNWRKALKIGAQIAKEITHAFSSQDLREIRKNGEEIMFTRTQPSVNVHVHDGKLLMTIRYVCKFHKRRGSEQQLWERILTRIEEEKDIQLYKKKSE